MFIIFTYLYSTYSDRNISLSAVSHPLFPLPEREWCESFPAAFGLAAPNLFVIHSFDATHQIPRLQM